MANTRSVAGAVFVVLLVALSFERTNAGRGKKPTTRSHDEWLCITVLLKQIPAWTRYR